MARDINLTSKKWNDIIFEGKHKDYGAYELRQSSSRRHIWAFVITVILVVLVSLLPAIMDKVASLRPVPDNISGDTTLADLALKEEIEKQEEVIQDATPPPPPLKSTIQFVAPEIVADEDIRDDDVTLKSQDELQASDAQVSLFDVEGSDEEIGIDKAELEEHREVAEEVVDNKIYDFVQQMPAFPGGEQELRKYLNSNARYPSAAAENGISGTVLVRFTVDRDGSIANITIVSSPDKSLSDEAKRLIANMPKWIPGRSNGVLVRVNYHVPVVFKLEMN